MTGMDLVHVPGLGRSEGAHKNARDRRKGGKPNADEKFEIEQRRVQVAALYLSKLSGRAIAKRLDVSHSTIRKDIEKIKEQWRGRAALDYQAVVDEELAKLDGLERALIPLAFQGHHNAVNDLLKLMDRKARLLGLDQPTRIEAKVEHVEVEAKRARAQELLDTAGDDELARRRERTA